MTTMTSMRRTSVSNLSATSSEILAIFLLSVLAILSAVNIVLWLILGARLAYRVLGRLLFLLHNGIPILFTATRDLFIMLATQLLDVVLRASGFALHIFYAALNVLFAYTRFALWRATASFFELAYHAFYATLKVFLAFARFALWRAAAGLLAVTTMCALFVIRRIASGLRSVIIWTTTLVLHTLVISFLVLGSVPVKLVWFINTHWATFTRVVRVGLVQLVRIMVEGISLAESPVPPQALTISTTRLPTPRPDYSLVLFLIALNGHDISTPTVTSFRTFTSVDLISAYQCSYCSSLRLLINIQVSISSSVFAILVGNPAHPTLLITSSSTAHHLPLASTSTTLSTVEPDYERTLCESFSDLKIDSEGATTTSIDDFEYEKTLCESFSGLKIDSEGATTTSTDDIDYEKTLCESFSGLKIDFKDEGTIEPTLSQITESPPTSEKKKLVPSRMRAFAQGVHRIKTSSSSESAAVGSTRPKAKSNWKGRITHAVRRVRKRVKEALAEAAADEQ